MQAIFITCYVKRGNDRMDISERVSKLVYDRDIEKENSMTVYVEQGLTERIDVPFVEKGDYLIVQYGYLNGKQSAIHTVRVTEIERKYGAKLQIIAKGRDEGNLMKKTTSFFVWQEKTLSQIAQTIATRYGLAYKETQPTTHIYKSLPQAQRSDWAFLQSVVGMEQTGRFCCYVSNSTLHLEFRGGTDNTSQWTFTYGDGIKIGDLSIKDTESERSASGTQKTRSVGYDKDKKEVVQGEADVDNEEEESWTDTFANVFSAGADALGVESEAEPDSESYFPKDVEYSDTNISGSSDQEELTATANSRKKSNTFKRKECTIKMEGLPETELNTIYTLAGVVQEDAGNYLIKSIKEDVVARSAYIMTITGYKNATKRPTQDGQNSVNPKDVNNTVGQEPNEEKKTVEIQVFDANSNKKVN